MARIRSIKPEIRISEKVNSWPVELRYFWIMLWGYVDDYGRGRDNPKLIVADTYPLDDSVSDKDVERWLKILARDEVIRRYVVDGKRYLLVQNWNEHQRPSHPARTVIPVPEPLDDAGGEDSGNPPEDFARTSANGSPEQGAVSSDQGAGEQEGSPPTTTVTEDFATAWAEYPIKKERKRAETAYKKALDDATPAEILAGVRKYRDDPERDPKFTKHFSTWLNAGCWDDEPSSTAKPSASSPWSKEFHK